MVGSIVLLLDGNRDIGAHLRSNLCYFICLRHFIRSRTVKIWIFSPKSPILLPACTTWFELPSNISTIVRG